MQPLIAASRVEQTSRSSRRISISQASPVSETAFGNSRRVRAGRLVTGWYDRRAVRSLSKLAAPVCMFALCVSSVAGAVSLKVGDPAPEFSLPGSDGKIHSLSSYKGKQVVVLAWFTKAYSDA
jgi:hypothetical protein